MKGKKASESLDFERRLGTGAALVDLGGELDKKDSEDVMAAFRADPDVAYVVPDRRMYAAAVSPNDSQYYRQWDLFEATACMNVPDAWDKATGSGVNVAVIDTGYVNHSDLAANVIAGYDFISDPWTANDGGGRDSNAADPGDWLYSGDCGTDANGNPVPYNDTNNSWHGTHVAGTIAASTNNSKGIAGIAYNATIQSVRVLGKCGGTTADITDGITWASGGYVPGVPSNPNQHEPRRQRRLRLRHPERHQRRRQPRHHHRRRGRQQQHERGRLQPGQLLRRHHGRRLRPRGQPRLLLQLRHHRRHHRPRR